MNNLQNQLISLQKQLEAAKSELSKCEGKREAILASLAEHGLHSVEEAEAYLKTETAKSIKIKEALEARASFLIKKVEEINDAN
jgi:hypothetical protein